MLQSGRSRSKAIVGNSIAVHAGNNKTEKKSVICKSWNERDEQTRTEEF
jgi:hypothetical protein